MTETTLEIVEVPTDTTGVFHLWCKCSQDPKVSLCGVKLAGGSSSWITLGRMERCVVCEEMKVKPCPKCGKGGQK